MRTRELYLVCAVRCNARVHVATHACNVGRVRFSVTCFGDDVREDRKVGSLRLLNECEVDSSSAFIVCSRATEENRNDGWRLG